MATTAKYSAFRSIVPPHILEEIAKRGSAAERQTALDALAADTTTRTRRLHKHLTGPVLSYTPAAAPAPHKQRAVYTAAHGTTEPGTLVRSEGQGPSGDLAVDEAYDGFGATFDLYWNIFHRNSIDNAGMNLIGTVHYGQNYDNAFWDGTEMVFGDGDGTYFNRFTAAVDVMGHELTHGVTAHEANLAYHDQPGALNESISDVFGSMVKQYAHVPQQTAAQADWLIGAGLFTSRVNGTALRSMKAPGTAYDDKVLGKDPQPDHMSKYVHTTSDSGGVHINSGIPNRAFYLAAVALGGYAWQKAGPIWYATLCDSRLTANAQFQDFANLTADNAFRLFGPTERQAVIGAWQQVGINVPVVIPQTMGGNWVLHYSWGATGSYGQASLTFNSDGTFAGAATGKWVQQDGTVLLSFDTGPAKYAGTVNGSVGSGAMSTFAGADGCWYLSRQGTMGLVIQLANGAKPAPFDVAGNAIVERVHRRESQHA